MCRNIKMLFNFDPPVTDDEIRAASLQFVRKVSGYQKAPAGSDAEFEKAIEDVAATTRALLARLPARGAPRTREGEKEKAKKRWALRSARG